MKRIYSFIRSMRFGMLLLLLIGTICVIATVSGREEIYSKWYFILLFAILGINLILCSVVRVFCLNDRKEALMKKAADSETVIETEEPEQWLKAHHFKKTGSGYLKHAIGFYGSFLTHAGMLLLMLAAACLFESAEREEISLCVGDTAELSDGTLLTVDGFRLEDEQGMTEYASSLTALLPDGVDVQGESRVNHPLHIGKYTVFQQNYNFAAVLGIRTGMDAEEETLKLNEPAFLSLDGENGIWYSQLFGNVVEENGEIRVMRGTEIIHPAYEVAVMDNGKQENGLIFPGTTVEAAGVFYSFRDPEAYPGLLVKTQPEWALRLLYFSFAVMTIGLYLCFFQIPEAAHVREKGIAIAGQKDISYQIEHYCAEENSKPKENFHN